MNRFEDLEEGNEGKDPIREEQHFAWNLRLLEEPAAASGRVDMISNQIMRGLAIYSPRPIDMLWLISGETYMTRDWIKMGPPPFPIMMNPPKVP